MGLTTPGETSKPHHFIRPRWTRRAVPLQIPPGVGFTSVGRAGMPDLYSEHGSFVHQISPFTLHPSPFSLLPSPLLHLNKYNPA
jgi:hypothetical protein